MKTGKQGGNWVQKPVLILSISAKGTEIKDEAEAKSRWRIQ